MPSMLATAARTRPSADFPVPDDVTDVLLWQLAVDVAVEHQRGPNGDCTNLRCAGQRGPCDAAVQAERALRAARRPAAAQRSAVARTSPAIVSPPSTVANQHPGRAIGQAAVPPPNAGRFTGWFTHTAATTVNRWRTHLPRRVPGAALAAA